MTRWLLLIGALGIATISDHSIAAEISRDQIATIWQSSCNPWVDYNCAAPKISPKTLDHLKEAIASAPSDGTEFGEKVKSSAEQNISATQEYVRELTYAKDVQDCSAISFSTTTSSMATIRLA